MTHTPIYCNFCRKEPDYDSVTCHANGLHICETCVAACVELISKMRRSRPKLVRTEAA